MSEDRPLSRRSALIGAVGISVTSAVGCTEPPATGPGPTSEAPVTAAPSRSSAPAPDAPTSRAPRATVEAPRSTSVLKTVGPDLTRGPAGTRAVALTFHGAGPRSSAEQVLSILDRASAPVTVFAVGTWLQSDPDLGHAFRAAGHDLGNHTWSHQTMTHLDLEQARREVQRGAAAVAAVLGRPGLLFRPSGTPWSNPTIRAAAHAAGYRRCISYDVDPSDYLDPGASVVRDRTLAQVRPGSIVSLHLAHPGTVAALPGILRGLARRRLEPVTLTTMFAG